MVIWQVALPPSCVDASDSTTPVRVAPAHRFVLALSAVNDPGNLGTLLRTAAALDWDAVVLVQQPAQTRAPAAAADPTAAAGAKTVPTTVPTPTVLQRFSAPLQVNCVDAFNTKAISAGRGSQWRIPLYTSMSWAALKASGLPLVFADSRAGQSPSAVTTALKARFAATATGRPVAATAGTAASETTASSSPGLVLVLGNEAHGLPDDEIASSDLRVTIPLKARGLICFPFSIAAFKDVRTAGFFFFFFFLYVVVF